MAEKTGIKNRSGISISALNNTGATDIANRLTITADGISTPDIISKNIMIIIWRPIEPKDTLLSTIKNITDRSINSIITAIR
jgi:hypothetical protein